MVYGGTDQVLAARKGAEWLIADQNSNGGWSGSDEIPEIDSEAAQALAAAMPKVPVGGEWIPIETFQILTPLAVSASLMAAATAGFVYSNRRRRRL